MNVFEVLADPVRREILETLADGEMQAGKVVTRVQSRFDMTQAAVSQHLRVLRENGFARMRAAGNRRLYSVEVTGLRQADAWLERFRALWEPRLRALGEEIARGKKQRSTPRIKKS